jgi:hypothetical protein
MKKMGRRARWGTLLCVLLFSASLATPGEAATTPLKAHAQLVEEVVGFLYSDTGFDGILTMDNLPAGEPVPPYFYHYAIKHTDSLMSSTSGYPGYASISYPGYTMAVAIDAFLAYWAYSADPEALGRARACADWLIPRRTPAGDQYANWVYSTQTDGVMGGGFDLESVMSDKPGMFGACCLRLYDITGEASYLACAAEIADTYVATQMSGAVGDDGRWPFRVRPADGLVQQDYTSHLIPAVRLLESMEARSPGNGYGLAAQRAWSWLANNPLNSLSPDYMHWEGFYEDVFPVDQIGDRDHYSAESTLVSLVERGAPGDLASAIDILNWSTARYTSPDNSQNGFGTYAPAMLEWDHWTNTTYAATGQWAYVNLLLDAAALGLPEHDPAWRTRGVEALHTLTYGQGTEPLPADDRMITTIRELTQPAFGSETWYEQNFNTVIYVLLGMGLATELAPGDENHLLRTEGAELTGVDYGSARITLSWSGASTATLKLTQQPLSVRIGTEWYPLAGASTPGWSWDAARQLCSVRQLGGEVEIALGGSTPAPRQPRPLMLPPYPNPFNPRVTVPIELASRARVEVSIFDVRGRRVRTLHAGSMGAGRHELIWDGHDDAGKSLASGNYAARLESSLGRMSRRIVLVR